MGPGEDLSELVEQGVYRNVVTSDAGREWLRTLPAVVAALQERWSIVSLGTPFTGGSHSLVAPVHLRDGSKAVLKVPLVDDENRLEAEALRLYDGDGAVELLKYDSGSGAMLLEQAVPGESLESLPDRADAIRTACALLRRLRRAVPANHRFALVTDHALAWSDRLRRRAWWLPDRASRHLARLAADVAAELHASPEEAVLVNRDAHLGNVLKAEREPFLLIDPKPLVGEAAFDAGYLIDWLIATDRESTSPGQLVSTVAHHLRVSEDRVRGWGLVRAMDNALWAVGRGEDPMPYVGTAEALAATP